MHQGSNTNKSGASVSWLEATPTTIFSHHEVYPLEAISKNGFWFNIKADARFNPEADCMDLNRAPNTEIGPKDFFEMASKLHYYA